MEPQRWPALGRDTVQVWAAHLPSLRKRLDDLVKLLSPEEQERASRFRFEAHRERSQLTRGTLRLLLGRHLACPPRHLKFAFNDHGKPELPGCPLHFNVSHSGHYATFAFTLVGAVGVDIEEIRGDVIRHQAIAQKHFAPAECEQLESVVLSERGCAFFDLWTCKESFVKARGDGVFSGLDRFEVSLKGARILSVDGRPAPNWWLARLPQIPGYAGAVAVQANACSPQFWKFTERCFPTSLDG